jgi:carbon-monoxide dehydrogenase medium subunit
MAGGTDLSVLFRAKAKTPAVVVWLGKAESLRGARESNGTMELGPLVTHSELARLPTLAGIASLAKAASGVGSPQIRNVGTVGGNLANASPADLYPPLLTLDARLELASVRRNRTVRLEDFATGPGSTALEPNEIITGVVFDKPVGKLHCDFTKIGLRNALAISVASAAVAAWAAGGKFEDVRIACGAVAPRPTRMREVERLLRGEALTPRLLSEVEAAASRACDPITDLRATGAYRRHVLGVIVSRLVEGAWRSLSGQA